MNFSCSSTAPSALGNDHGFVEHHLAERFAEVGVLTDHFGDDVTRSFERFVHAADAFFGADKSRCEFGEWHGRRFLRPQVQCERFEALLARDSGFGAAFGFVGQVQVFQFAFVECGEDAVAQVVRQLSLFLNRSEHGVAAIFEFTEVSQLLFNRTYLDLVQIAGTSLR